MADGAAVGHGLPMTPNEFSGGWHRRCVDIDGAGPVEASTVIWLQAGARFIDLRNPVATSNGCGPLDGPGAFAGTTSFENSVLTQRHEFDVPQRRAGEVTNAHTPAIDTGRVEWVDGMLLEAGELESPDRTIRYIEQWCRLDSAESPTYAIEPSTGTGLGVRCGDHVAALHITDNPAIWAAVYLRQSRIGWMPSMRLGNPNLAIALEADIAEFVDWVSLSTGDPDTRPAPRITQWSIEDSNISLTGSPNSG